MISGFQSHSAARYSTEYLLDPWLGLRYLLFDQHFARLVQNAVVGESTAPIHSDRQIILIKIFSRFVATVLFFFIIRSPFHCALSASILGTVPHPFGVRPT